jgi:primosomal protein N' (replication factor Y)
LPHSLLLKSSTRIYLTEKAKDPVVLQNLSKKEKEFLNFINEKSYSSNYLRKKFKNANKFLSRLKKRGLVEIKYEFHKLKTRRKLKELPFKDFYQLEFCSLLNEEEKFRVEKVIRAIQKRNFASFLIIAEQEQRFNSYLEFIKLILEQNRKVLYILPEISLTQTVIQELRTKINDKIAVLHSGLTEKQRESIWKAIRNNNYNIVVGSRSSIFLPVSDLGLIIVDQEEDDSYFQKDTIFYNFHNFVNLRAQIEKAILIFGSQAPTVESFYKAKENNELIIFPKEEKKITSSVVIFNPYREKNIICEILKAKIKEKLSQDERIIIFFHKKGIKQFFVCRECGYLLKCPECHSALSYNSKKKKIFCTSCNYLQPKPYVCTVCGGKIKKVIGRGTGLIEKEFKLLFPNVKIGRFDSEALKNRRLREKVVENFNKGKIKILIGTQLLLYHKFKEVSLLVILFPENMLGFQDYKAGERTFQILKRLSNLLTKKGEIVIQTSFPDNYVIRSLKNFDYEHFYKKEIKYREILEYPPFTNLVEIAFIGPNLRRLAGYARNFISELKESNLELKFLGPVLMPKTNSKFKVKVFLKAKDKNLLRNSVKNYLGDLINKGEVFIYI